MRTIRKSGCAGDAKESNPARGRPGKPGRLLGIFPKSFGHLEPGPLAVLLREAGLEACNAIIRNGYWVTREGIVEQLPRFLKAVRGEGLVVHFATPGYMAPELLADPSPLGILAENGITDFRMGYFRVPVDGDPRLAFEQAHREMAQMAELCARYGLRAIYQLHHGTLITNAWSAWRLVEGLSPEHVGVEIDPGNQSFEGSENWSVAARVLGDYLAAVGVKDTKLAQDPARIAEPAKGWRRSWCPIDEGVTNWQEVIAGLNAVGFQGPLVFMPFYDAENPSLIPPKLRREVAYLHQRMQDKEAP